MRSSAIALFTNHEHHRGASTNDNPNDNNNGGATNNHYCHDNICGDDDNHYYCGDYTELKLSGSNGAMRSFDHMCFSRIFRSLLLSIWCKSFHLLKNNDTHIHRYSFLPLMCVDVAVVWNRRELLWCLLSKRALHQRAISTVRVSTSAPSTATHPSHRLQLQRQSRRRFASYWICWQLAGLPHSRSIRRIFSHGRCLRSILYLGAN